MASPKIVSFFIFDPTTGNPVTGQTMTFVTYKNELGTNVSQPTIIEIGGGAYYFTPVFTGSHGIAYCIDCGVGANPAKVSGYLRPEDYYTDNVDATSSSILTAVGTVQSDITDLKDEALGQWRIFTSGSDANRLVLYRQDGVTVLKKFDLTDSVNAPTTTNPYRRTPV